LGGVLFAAALWLPLGADAITFAVATLLVAIIPGTFRQTGDDTPQGSMWSDIRDGLRWLWNQPLIRNLALISTALGTIGYVTGAVFVLFAREELGLSSIEFGLLLVPPAIGRAHLHGHRSRNHIARDCCYVEPSPRRRPAHR
jgi:hypothetical protein